MLQRVEHQPLRELPTCGLAADLDETAAQADELLAGWPTFNNGRRPPPLVRFGGSGEGRLVQTGGRAARVKGRGSRGATDDRTIYAVGDVHGCHPLFLSLLARLAADAAEATAAPTLILLGDYVDRGPHSARVLETLCRLQGKAPFDLCLLKGNHEDALLKFIDAPEGAAPWLGFGGAATLRSYGVEPPGPSDAPSAYADARDALLRRMPAAHLRLLQGLDLMAWAGDYAFVHAGVAPGEPLRRQAERDLLWIRGEFLKARGPFEKIIVHGHSWSEDAPSVTPARIGVDTGAYETGVLGAMRLEGESRTWIEVRDPTRPRWRSPDAPPPWSPVAEPLVFTNGATTAWSPVVGV